MTIQIRWLIANPCSWDYDETWTDWRTYSGHPDYTPDDCTKFEIREKPSFEPGYFVDVSLIGEDRDRSSFADQPLRVIWFDEQPVGEGWERAVVYNDHLD